MRLSARISSATAVVGPLAPSTMIRALIWSALRLVITFSVAAGIRISQSETISSSLGHGLGAAEAKHGSVPILVFDQLMNVDPVRIVHAAIFFGDANDLVTVLHHQPRSIRAHVAKALDNHAAAVVGRFR